MLWFTIYCKYHDWVPTYLTLTLCSLSVFSNFQWSSVVASHIRDTFFKLFQLPTIGHVVFIWKSQIHWAESVERFGICRNWVRLPGAPMTRLRLRNICGISLGKFQYNNFISGTTVHLSAKASGVPKKPWLRLRLHITGFVALHWEKSNTITLPVEQRYICPQRL